MVLEWQRLSCNFADLIINLSSLAVRTPAFRPVGALFDEVENLSARSGKGFKPLPGKKT